MRVIARPALVAFWSRHPKAESPLRHWERVTKGSEWLSTQDVQNAFSKAKVISLDRVRFDVAGGDYRLIVAFDFRRQVAFVKFIGSHAEYDRVDARTVSQF